VLGTRWWNFYPSTSTLNAAMHSVADGQTCRRHHDANSGSTG